MRSFLSYAVNTITTISPRYWQTGLDIIFNGVQILTFKKIFDISVQENMANLSKSHWNAMGLALLCGVLGEFSAWASPLTVKESLAVSSLIMSANILIADASAYVRAKNIFSQASPGEAKAATAITSGLHIKYAKALMMVVGIITFQMNKFSSADQEEKQKNLWTGSTAGGYIFSTYSFLYFRPLVRSLTDPATARYLQL